MSPLVFLDTETTGLDPDLHEIWEVALVSQDSDGSNWERTWQLPVDLGRADPIALNIGRFHDRRLPDDKLTPLRVFAAEFEEMTRGAHLAGAVISFDEERLRRLLRREHYCPMWHYHLVDVEALAAGWVAATVPGDTLRVERADGSLNHINGRPPWNSNDLSLAVGVDPQDFDRHSALGDAFWAQAIYAAVMSR